MHVRPCGPTGSSGITWSFPQLSPTLRNIRKALLARSPLYLGLLPFAFDLHVLAMPPAFNLSQDQTLHFVFYLLSALRRVACRRMKQTLLPAIRRSPWSSADESADPGRRLKRPGSYAHDPFLNPSNKKEFHGLSQGCMSRPRTGEGADDPLTSANGCDNHR